MKAKALKNNLQYLVFLLAVPLLFVRSSFVLTLVINISIYAVYAMSYDILMGYSGIVSMGHAMFFGLGSYVVAFTTVKLKWHFAIGLILAAVVCSALAFIISLLTIRVKNVYFNMVTMAIGQLLFVMAMKLTSITGGDDGLTGMKSIFPNKTVFSIFAVVFMLLVYFLCKRIVNSGTGRVLQAIRCNEGRVDLLGYNVYKYKMIVLQVAGILAGLAGVFYVMLVGIAYPTLLSSAVTLQGLFMVVLGGASTLKGAIVGATIIRLADTVLSRYTNRWSLIMGIAFVVMVLFFPDGIMGIVGKIKGKISKKSKE